MKYAFLVIFFFLTSCRLNEVRKNDEADKKDAEKVIDSFYSLLGQKNIEGCLKLFYTKSYNVDDSQRLIDYLVNASNQPLLAKKLESWNTENTRGLDAGTIDTMCYINEYGTYAVNAYFILINDADSIHRLKIKSIINTNIAPERINNDADKMEGEKIADDLYYLLGNNKIDESIKLFHSNVLKNIDNKKIIEILYKTAKQLPLLKERKLDHWMTKTTQGINIHTFDSLYYICKFENYELKTSIILENDVFDDNKIKIITYVEDDDEMFKK